MSHQWSNVVSHALYETRRSDFRSRHHNSSSSREGGRDSSEVPCKTGRRSSTRTRASLSQQPYPSNKTLNLMSMTTTAHRRLDPTQARKRNVSSSLAGPTCMIDSRGIRVALRDRLGEAHFKKTTDRLKNSQSDAGVAGLESDTVRKSSILMTVRLSRLAKPR